MASRQLYRKSRGKIRLPVDSAQVVDQGDLVWLNTDDVRPASAFTYVSSNLAGTQANFAGKFVGVAAEASAAGDTDDITVDTEGVFEFDCAAAQFEVGDRVGVDDNAGGTALVDQQVIAIGENGYGAIGRVAKRYSANTTRVLVEVFDQNRNPAPMVVTVFSGLITNAADIVINFTLPFPYKLVALRSIVTVATAGGSTVLTVDKNSTSLDHTQTVAASKPIGFFTRTAMDDATGDDIFIVGDTLSIASGGAASGGEMLIQLEIYPYLLES